MRVTGNGGCQRLGNRFVIRVFFAALALLGSAALAPAQTANPDQQETTPAARSVEGQAPSGKPFQLVLPRNHFLGDWFGLRTQLEDFGITPTLTFESDIASNVSGGLRAGSSEADNLGLDLLFDLNKLAHIENGSFLLSMSQRSGSDLSRDDVGNVFTIQQVFGGQTFHLIDAAYQQKLFDDHVELRIGRIAAGDDFLVSPYNYLFMQNAFDGNPVGIFFNSPGMTAYPNATWGALVKVKPTQRFFVMGGIYNGDPTIRTINHHGADLTLDGPLFAMGAIGYTRNGLPGDSGLIGNYSLGFWYDNTSFPEFTSLATGQPQRRTRGSWGGYATFDQVLMRFSGADSVRGMGIFGSVTVAPDQSISQLPLFITGGVAIRGIVESRPIDVAAFGVAYGHFSNDLRNAQEREQLLNPSVNVQDYEMALEWLYRFRFNRRAFFIQPDIQYIIHPGGSDRHANAVVVGAQIGVNF